MSKKAKKNVYKPADVFDQFVKEVFGGKSPLDVAFEIWKEPTKRIKEKEKQNED